MTFTILRSIFTGFKLAILLNAKRQRTQSFAKKLSSLRNFVFKKLDWFFIGHIKVTTYKKTNRQNCYSEKLSFLI
jgi:hypothetical protein